MMPYTSPPKPVTRKKPLAEIKPPKKERKKTHAFLGTLLIALSGLAIQLDMLAYPNIFENSELLFLKEATQFKWILVGFITPVLICAGTLLRPYLISYGIPVFFYLLQLEIIFTNTLTRTLPAENIWLWPLLVMFLTGIYLLEIYYKPVKGQNQKSGKIIYFNKELKIPETAEFTKKVS